MENGDGEQETNVEKQETNGEEQETNGEVWTESTQPCDDFNDDNSTNDLHNSICFMNNIQKIITIFIYQLFALQSVHSLSDNVMEIIINIVRSLLLMLSTEHGNDMDKIKKLFPTSLYTAKQMMNLENNSFTKYVSCSECFQIYKPEDCFTVNGGKKEGVSCSHIKYPNHPQARYREKCNTPLMKTVNSAHGSKIYLYPIRLYCYQPLKQSLQNLISRVDLRDKLLSGPVKSPEGVMFDTVDGKFWKTFLDEQGVPYFNDARNLGGILNIDWFQPFDNVEHSCGVIYIALLNLPREVRFKWENIIVIGIIPGPKEPKKNVNSYLKPLVDDLLSLWKGEFFTEGQSKALYKFALCCISSDLPATRKCCGFVSYNANRGK